MTCSCSSRVKRDFRFAIGYSRHFGFAFSAISTSRRTASLRPGRSSCLRRQLSTARMNSSDIRRLSCFVRISVSHSDFFSVMPLVPPSSVLYMAQCITKPGSPQGAKEDDYARDHHDRHTVTVRIGSMPLQFLDCDGVTS